jgi:anti-sigma B factor antagonist
VQISIRQQGSLTIIALAGELTAVTSPVVMEQTLPFARDGHKLVLDMRRVHYISSAGLRVLLLLHRQTLAHGGKVVLAGLTEALHDIMYVTGFSSFFAIHSTVAEGVEALQQDRAG